MASDKKAPVVIKNKKAYHDYHVLQTFEAGIVLLGSEVKSIRTGNAQLKGNFIQEWHGDLLVEHMHISPYKFAHHLGIPALRSRKLLLNKKEVAKIISEISTKGISATVLSLYFKGPFVKAEIGIVRGKKLHDKRESLKQKDQKRQLDKAIKRFSVR